MDYKTLSVQRMQDFINSNLYNDIRFFDIVSQSYYSPWYARRIHRVASNQMRLEHDALIFVEKVII